MKAWKEFGSSHSANMTVIGEFETADEAEVALPVIEDFVRASWEQRYPDLRRFVEAWTARDPNLPHIGLSEEDYEIGVDQDPDVACDGDQVLVTHLRTQNVSGIVKLLLHKGMKEIRISGHGA